MPESTLSAEHPEDYFRSDAQFNNLYPPSISALAEQHWTPLAVARKAAAFLYTHESVRILDIGCGAGKFCLAAAHFAPGAQLFGVEQRQRLLHQATNARDVLGINNVHFIHGNFTQIDFSNYDHFYFYNAFYENLEGIDKMDDTIEYSSELFHYYNRYLHRQLSLMPAGTRLVTYHSAREEVPAGYEVAQSLQHHLLKCWVKV